jgi:CDP-diacylglycerol--glycerol-3-phosphate 3-phosphatidyltransferase
VPAWTIVAILAREFLVTGARSLAAGDGAIIAASSWGKAKTVIQMVYIYAFLFLAIVGMALDRWLPDWSDEYARVLRPASLTAIILVALFTVYSGIEFARTNWQTLNLGKIS